MTYQQALDYIHGLLKFGIHPSLDHIRELLGLLGNPQEKLHFVHVAGTNGKGSTCTMLASVLSQAGYKTGLYTSPYITDFCERIQIDGQMIPHEDLVRTLERILPFIQKLEGQITEFEAITAIMFSYFAEKQCDLVVLETGLGGRFDATNVIESPLVSVITSISLDHMNILGDTIEQIAGEKCGIMKPGVPVVSYPEQDERALGVIMEQAAQKGSRVYIPSRAAVSVQSEDIRGMTIDYGDLHIAIPLAGEHQIDNALTVIETIRVLKAQGIAISDEELAAGIQKVRFPARLERLCEKPLVLLDGAHNDSGAKALAGAVTRFLPNRRIYAVVGMLRDKQTKQMLARIAPLCEQVIATTIDNPRSLSAVELAEQAAEFCANVFTEETPVAAFDRAYAASGAQDVVLVCGSLYLAGELRPYILEKVNKEK